MANETRGQIRTDFDGTPINLILTTDAICSLEAEEKRRAYADAVTFGLPLELVKPRKINGLLSSIGGDPDDVSMTDVVMLFWSLMLADRPEATMKDATRLIDSLRGRHDQVMTAAILAAFPEANPDADADGEPGK